MEHNISEGIIELPLLEPNNFLDTSYRSLMGGQTSSISYFDYEWPTAHSYDTSAKKPAASLNTISLVPMVKHFEAGTASISASIPLGQEKELRENFGIEIIENVKRSLKDECLNAEMQMLYDKYKELGNISRKKNWKKYHHYIENKLKIELSDILDEKDLGKSLDNKISLYSNLISISCRRGRADFLICNRKITSYLEESKNFIFNSKSEITSGTIYLVGNIFGVEVYTNTLEKEDVIVFGRKTSSNEPGVLYGEYKRTIEVSESTGEDLVTFKRVNLRSRVAVVSISNKASDNYYTLKIKLSNDAGFFKKKLVSIIKPKIK